MTIYWVDEQGKIGFVSSAEDNPPPKGMGTLTPLDSDVHGAPEHGSQTWDGRQWSAPPTLGPPPSTAGRISRLEAVLKAKGVITDADLKGA